MTEPEVLFLSIRPPFATAILEKKKTAELRRTRPRVSVGTPVLLYSSSPTCAAVGVAIVAELVEGTRRTLWRSVAKQCGVRLQEFNTYFEDAHRCFAIRLTSVQRLEKPVPLEIIRARLPGFQPPQAFRYLTTGQARRLAPELSAAK